MPAQKSARLHLVPVAEIPKTVRRGIYVDLVDEFEKSDMKTAKVEGARPASAVSIRKAVATLGLANISVRTAGGEVYLTKS